MKTALTMASLIFVCAIGVSTVARATNAHPVLAVSQDQPAQPAEPKAQAKSQTFLGTIMKSGNEFVFSDDATKLSYQLDDQQTASKFDGKKVRVVGMLDSTNKLIRVQSIEAAA